MWRRARPWRTAAGPGARRGGTMCTGTGYPSPGGARWPALLTTCLSLSREVVQGKFISCRLSAITNHPVAALRSAVVLQPAPPQFTHLWEAIITVLGSCRYCEDSMRRAFSSIPGKQKRLNNDDCQILESLWWNVLGRFYEQVFFFFVMIEVPYFQKLIR